MISFTPYLFFIILYIVILSSIAEAVEKFVVGISKYPKTVLSED